MSCLMRAFAHCNTETTWAQDFFFLSYVFFFYVRVSRALITITSQRNQFPRQGTLGQSASGHLSLHRLCQFSRDFPFVRGEHAGNLLLLSWSLNEEWFHFRNLRLARQRKAQKFLAAKSLEICESNQSAAYVLLHSNPETNVAPWIDVCSSAICLFLDSVSNYIDVCVFRANFPESRWPSFVAL